AAHRRNVTQTHGQRPMPQAPWRRVFEPEIDRLDQQVYGDERFAIFPLAQDRGVVADSEDQVGRARFRRLIANAFYEVELALHSTEKYKTEKCETVYYLQGKRLVFTNVGGYFDQFLRVVFFLPARESKLLTHFIFSI